MHCLAVKADLIPSVVDQGCQPTPAQDQDVYDACDLDPTTDYDEDGDTGNDDDEACAGFP
jgi:hypothetical protein